MMCNSSTRPPSNLTLISQERICPAGDRTIGSSSTFVTFHRSPSVCVVYEVYFASYSLFADPITPPQALSFIKPLSFRRSDQYEIVQNSGGVFVGQIITDVIQIKRIFPNNTDPIPTQIDICFLSRVCSSGNCTSCIANYSASFPITDLGVVNSGGYVDPIRYTQNSSSTFIHCPDDFLTFYNVTLTEEVTNIMGVIRLDDYEAPTFVTPAEEGV